MKRSREELQTTNRVLRQKVLALRLAGSLAIFVAVLASTPTMSAQTVKPTEPAKTQDAAAPLSHDLSGVWMQYPDGPAPGVPGMNAVSNRARPPLTPWGQAKFDAAKPAELFNFTFNTPLAPRKPEPPAWKPAWAMVEENPFKLLGADE